MADFYVKYGSKGAVLIASYICGLCNIKLHRVKTCEYILSKNRKILAKYDIIDRALKGFHNCIYLNNSDTLFNN